MWQWRYLKNTKANFHGPTHQELVKEIDSEFKPITNVSQQHSNEMNRCFGELESTLGPTSQF